MNEYNDISELLEADKHAMAFYNSLPLTTQRKLHREGVRSIKELYSRAAPAPVAGVGSMNTASSDECTGCVPAGGDLSPDEWQSAKDISQ